MTRWQADAAGRLRSAAIALFSEQGYERTTIAEIAAKAGLTKRTFFRHFSDKSAVLFDDDHHLGDVWTAAISLAPDHMSAVDAVELGFDAVGETLAPRHEFARVRSEILTTADDLRARELIKLSDLSFLVSSSLRRRGTDPRTSTLAAQAGMTVFQLSFHLWIAQEDPCRLAAIMHECMSDFRCVMHP